MNLEYLGLRMVECFKSDNYLMHRHYSDYLNNEEKKTHVSIECGSILLTRSAMRIYFSCTFCGVELQNLKEFLKHSLQNHMGLKETDLATILSENDISEYEVNDHGSTNDKFLDLENNDKRLEIECINNAAKTNNMIEKFKNFVSNCNSDVNTESSISGGDRPEDQGGYESEADLRENSENDDLSGTIGSFEVVIMKANELASDAGKRSNRCKVSTRKLSATKESFQCTDCGKQRQRQDRLNIHMNCRQELKSYVCEFCDARFPDSSNWKVHRYRHLGIKPHSCTNCDKSFTSSTELKQHNRSHTGERPFTCIECGKSFSCSAHLNSHSRRHTNDRRYVCATCGKRFFELKLLRDHEVSHSTERPFECEQCKMRFSRIKALREHAKLHSDVKKYVCQLCSKAFAQCAGLHSHMKSHLPRKPDRTKQKGQKDI